MIDGADAAPHGAVAERRIAAILTVFNRKPLTLACLEALDGQRTPGVHITAYIVDDGSTDGTGAAVAERHPDAVVLPGDGTLFWNGGMRWAFARAMSDGFDFYLWMNDDTTLDVDGLKRLVATYDNVAANDPHAIVVGATREPGTGDLSYGGVVRPNARRPLHFERVPVANDARRVEAMNGNCVLIPHVVAERVGNIDPAYLQKLGDFDYGLRASAARIPIWVAPGTVGTCASHAPRRSDNRPLGAEIRRLWSAKELPFGPWSAFARRWGGAMWPVFFLSPYLRRSFSLVMDRVGSSALRPRSNADLARHVQS